MQWELGCLFSTAVMDWSQSKSHKVHHHTCCIADRCHVHRLRCSRWSSAVHQRLKGPRASAGGRVEGRILAGYGCRGRGGVLLSNARPEQGELLIAMQHLC